MMNNNNFVKSLLKNTEILKLKNTKNNNRQLLFWLKKIPLNKEISMRFFYTKLLNSYISTFFSSKDLYNWKCQFSEKDLFKTIHVTILTSFQINNQKIKPSEIFDAKISLLNKSSDMMDLWDRSKFTAYEPLAPDCMGPWLVYWRMNMPGFGNEATDQNGLPMKNWWVFLFY